GGLVCLHVASGFLKRPKDLRVERRKGHQRESRYATIGRPWQWLEGFAEFVEQLRSFVCAHRFVIRGDQRRRHSDHSVAGRLTHGPSVSSSGITTQLTCRGRW